jgi:hypothetical protein
MNGARNRMMIPTKTIEVIINTIVLSSMNLRKTSASNEKVNKRSKTTPYNNKTLRNPIVRRLIEGGSRFLQVRDRFSEHSRRSSSFLHCGSSQ